MAYQIEIKAEDIENAASYVGLSVKEEFTRGVANVCIEPVNVTDGDSPLPTMYRENRKIRAQYMMGTLATMLGKPFNAQKYTVHDHPEEGERELVGCMDEDDYNAWAGSHVMNQLERWKKGQNKELSNKVFDILYEYRNFDILLSAAIRDELDVRNDAFNRAMRYFGTEAASALMKNLMSNEDMMREVVKELRPNG